MLGNLSFPRPLYQAGENHEEKARRDSDHEHTVQRLQGTQYSIPFTHYQIPVAKCREVHDGVVERRAEAFELAEGVKQGGPQGYLHYMAEKQQEHYRC